MGPRPEERTTPTNGIEESAEVDVDSPTHGNNNGTRAFTEEGPETIDSTEAWAMAEGYTPLSELNNDGDGGMNSYMMVSMGPGDDSDSEDNAGDRQEGNFNEGTGAFYVNPAAFGHADETNTAAPFTEDIDFEELAASALSALDEEYQQTVGLSQENAAKDKKDDEDLKIIAAGFDQRKEELERISAQGGFMVQERWEDSEGNASSSIVEQQEEVNKANVDTDAIRKAIESLSVKNKDARFQQKFNAWQQKQQQQQQGPNKTINSHLLIPPASYKAFHNSKPTSKSREATADLTRSATLAEAIVRLSLLSSFQDNNDASLLIDVVGVDHIECQSAATIRDTFRPFVRWIRDYAWSVQGRVRKNTIHLHFRLIGRELTPMTMAEGGVVDLLESPSTSIRATATCHSGVYHEFLDELMASNTECEQTNEEDNLFSKTIIPDLAVAFNAGVWGYQEWATTMQYLAQVQISSTMTSKLSAAEAKRGKTNKQSGLPMVITAYTLDECQEDQEVIFDAIASLDNVKDTSTNTINPHRADILWESERNPFGSQVIRETKGSTQEYRENACWQAWSFGRNSAEQTE